MNISMFMIIYFYIDYKEDKVLINNYLKMNYDYQSHNSKTYMDKEKYIGIIEIPKINLKRGFYDIQSKKNNVNNNVTILEHSTLPNIKNNILVLASHSGNGIKSYFKNIDTLQINDQILLYYQNNLYVYLISDIYKIEKNGILNISYIDNSQLILTTCDKNDKNKQLVIKSILKEINTY